MSENLQFEREAWDDRHYVSESSKYDLSSLVYVQMNCHFKVRIV